jgi:hypothetical protein
MNGAKDINEHSWTPATNNEQFIMLIMCNLVNEHLVVFISGYVLKHEVTCFTYVLKKGWVNFNAPGRGVSRRGRMLEN